jgi:hypothetical protein
LLALQSAGCRTVYIDGSFVTTKLVPNDFDACWDIEGVDPESLDPVLLIFDEGRATQKAKYLGELLPAQLSESDSGGTFLDFSRWTTRWCMNRLEPYAECRAGFSETGEVTVNR